MRGEPQIRPLADCNNVMHFGCLCALAVFAERVPHEKPFAEAPPCSVIAAFGRRAALRVFELESPLSILALMSLATHYARS